MSNFLFTSESVAIGHPDKVADQIADAILDSCLQEDRNSRVACEVMVTGNVVVLAGEITTQATVDFEQVARDTIARIGYTERETGFDAFSCEVMKMIHKQSSDIALGIGSDEALGAGDQGMMFGFACEETEELMPLPIMLAHRIVSRLRADRESGFLPFLYPDGKAQVTVEYETFGVPKRVDTVVLSAQHRADASSDMICQELTALIQSTVPPHLLDQRTRYLVNPAGRFVIGGPVADCGLTGRKIVVDTYGGMAHLGGGAFSGKDPTKVDRTGAYTARYIAKNIVAAKLAKRCEVQVSYAIGYQEPVAIYLNFFGTGVVLEEVVVSLIPKIFDLTPSGMIKMLDLQRPIYSSITFGGHFGRSTSICPWEKTDKVEELLQSIAKIV